MNSTCTVKGENNPEYFSLWDLGDADPPPGIVVYPGRAFFRSWNTWKNTYEVMRRGGVSGSVALSETRLASVEAFGEIEGRT